MPTELRDMDKASKEDLGYDQAQEGNWEAVCRDQLGTDFAKQNHPPMRTMNMLAEASMIPKF